MKHSLVVAWLVFLTAFSAVGAQTKYKNIKVLNSLSDNDIAREMQAWSKALGERCTFCHEGNDYVSDANPKKDIARKMATMVMVINKDYLNGKASCVLCHRGATIPDPNTVPTP